jgi:hypothetical protein
MSEGISVSVGWKTGDPVYPDDSDCPNNVFHEAHTPHPRGYTAFFDWCKHMSKTHRQVRCPLCGKYAIWERKNTRPKKEQ